jgi:indolepyruvate ferredoxin oxidoreductase
VNGFCPSFVSVEGGNLKKGMASSAQKAASPNWSALAEALPAPVQLPIEGSSNNTYGILVTGVGGSGVVTIGQLLGMAAHIEGKGVSVLDMAGLAQKGGAVFSHVQIAQKQEQLFSTRIATGEADLLIGCDLIVAAGHEALSKMRPSVTRAVVNSDVQPTSEFIRNRDWSISNQDLKNNILTAAGQKEIDFIDANALALAHMSDALYTNPLLMGYAWQRGWIPLSRQAMMKAIELNDMAIANNVKAFCIGQLAAAKPQLVAVPAPTPTLQTIEFKRDAKQLVKPIDEILTIRAQELTLYQNKGYADRYLQQVNQVIRLEEKLLLDDSLSRAVAHNLFKLMAYKDEYEVARLMSTDTFKHKIAAQFEGDFTLAYHLAPPLLSRIDSKTGRPKKIRFGPWLGAGFKCLAKMKPLRGTVFDVFGATHERRLERALVVEYMHLIHIFSTKLKPSDLVLALKLAKIPEEIRGYGPVKLQAMKDAQLKRATLLNAFNKAC